MLSVNLVCATRRGRRLLDEQERTATRRFHVELRCLLLRKDLPHDARRHDRSLAARGGLTFVPLENRRIVRTRSPHFTQQSPSPAQ